jgi:predicted outer membrane repeat protein
MKKKQTAQLRHRVASTRRISVFGFFNLHTRSCLALFCSVSISAYADIITVTKTNDSGPGSLRQALVDSQDGDTIDFDPSLKGQTISLTSAELVINKSITISGPGPNLLAVSRAQNAPAFRIFNLIPGRSVTIQGLTISNGLAPEFGCGGGILDEGSSLSLMNCTVSGNSTDGTGGGICAESKATLTIESSTLSGNYAGDYGGGIANNGTLTINNSTLSGNRGEFSAGAILNGFNGDASLTVNNSTLSGNTTQLHGGGIFNEGQSAIGNSTLSGNSGMTAGAIYNRLATLDIESTILNRGELGPNILNDGTVTSHGYNLSSDDGSGYLIGPGDQINTDPLLGPLQNNGGPTFTHQLLPGSPAIDTGDPNFTPPPFLDQRGSGFPRVVSGRIDKGSFEVQQGPTPTSTPRNTPTSTPAATAPATATATPTASPAATATPTSTSRPSPTPRFAPTPRPHATPPPRP